MPAPDRPTPVVPENWDRRWAARDETLRGEAVRAIAAGLLAAGVDTQASREIAESVWNECRRDHAVVPFAKLWKKSRAYRGRMARFDDLPRQVRLDDLQDHALGLRNAKLTLKRDLVRIAEQALPSPGTDDHGKAVREVVTELTSLTGKPTWRDLPLVIEQKFAVALRSRGHLDAQDVDAVAQAVLEDRCWSKALDESRQRATAIESAAPLLARELAKRGAKNSLPCCKRACTVFVAHPESWEPTDRFALFVLRAAWKQWVVRWVESQDLSDREMLSDSHRDVIVRILEWPEVVDASRDIRGYVAECARNARSRAGHQDAELIARLKTGPLSAPSAADQLLLGETRVFALYRDLWEQEKGSPVQQRHLHTFMLGLMGFSNSEIAQIVGTQATVAVDKCRGGKFFKERFDAQEGTS